MYITLTLLVLVLSLNINFCQNRLEPIFQPLNDSHMMILFNSTLVEKMNHIKTVLLRMAPYNYIENRNLAVASKEYTKTFQDTAKITLFQPLDLTKGLMVKMDSCQCYQNLFLVVHCIVGAPSSSDYFSYVPIDYIEDDLDTWICKQDDTTIWMNTARSNNFHAKKCIQHVNLYQNGEHHKISNGWNTVQPISQEVNLTIKLPHCTELLEVKLDQCRVSIERLDYEVHSDLEQNSSEVLEKQEHEVTYQFATNSSEEYENNHQFKTNSSDAIRNVTELLEDLGFVQDELTEDQSAELPHVYIWIGVSAVAAVFIVAIITVIAIKVRRIRTEKKQANIDTNPEYGDGDYDYYRQTELCDSNEAYYQN